MSTDAMNEVDQNFAAFELMLPSLMETEKGKFALLHRSELVDVFESSIAAYIAGLEKFGENSYSVQEVTDELDSLGFYSYAGGAGQA